VKQTPRPKESERLRREGSKGGKGRSLEPESLEAKMAAVVRPGKESKLGDKLYA